MSPEPRTPTPPAAPSSPAHLPLLDYVIAHSLDEDYAQVARRASPEEGSGEPTAPRPGLTALAVVAAFGLLVATAAVQTARNAEDQAAGRQSLVTQVRAESEQLDARRAWIRSLREEIDSLQTVFLEASSQGRSLSARLARLGAVTGTEAVTGPGVKVVVDDAPGAVSVQQRVLDEDLRKLVNALWLSGAEAVSLNGHRITSVSAIGFAGSAITVNKVSLARPYTVLAVGNPDTMPARFVDTEHGSDWLDLHAVYGLEFNMTSEESMRLPALRRVVLRHATAEEAP